MVRYGEGSKLAGIIYIHCISDKRFPEISARNFKIFRELCGGTTLKNVVLVTNMWGEVSQDVGEARERELTTKIFKPVLDEGAQIARYHYTPESAHDIIRRIMKNQWEYADGAAREKFEWSRHHQAEINALREEMEQALRDKDEEVKKELEEENRKVREELNRLREESERLTSAYSEERRRMEAEMRRMQEEARAEKERLLDRLNSCLRRCPRCGQ